MLVEELLLEKINDAPLRPSSVVAIRLGQESAVASMIGFNERDVRIGLQLLARLWHNADKWIVLGMNHQRRHSNLVHYAGGGSTVIVIVSAAESAVRRRGAIYGITATFISPFRCFMCWNIEGSSHNGISALTKSRARISPRAIASMASRIKRGV